MGQCPGPLWMELHNVRCRHCMPFLPKNMNSESLTQLPKSLGQGIVDPEHTFHIFWKAMGPNQMSQLVRPVTLSTSNPRLQHFLCSAGVWAAAAGLIGWLGTEVLQHCGPEFPGALFWSLMQSLLMGDGEWVLNIWLIAAKGSTGVCKNLQ